VPVARAKRNLKVRAFHCRRKWTGCESFRRRKKCGRERIWGWHMGRNDALSHQSKNGPVLGYCVNWVCRL